MTRNPSGTKVHPSIDISFRLGHHFEREEPMSDDLSAEFESYRKRLRTDEEKQAFDRKIKELLQERGVDYVRGYVDGLKESL
jgi:hypothetical protein